jgi:hypothetical protein
MSAEICLKEIIPKNKKMLYVEVGVLRATNLIALANLFPLLDIIGIDSYETYLDTAHGYSVSKELSTYNKYVAEQKIQNSEYKNRIKLLIRDSFLVAQETENNSIDVVFLDKNFSEDSIMADIFDWYPKIKVGGILCGHDAYTQEIMSGVKKALFWYKIDNISIVADEVWWIKKI